MLPTIRLGSDDNSTLRMERCRYCHAFLPRPLDVPEYLPGPRQTYMICPHCTPPAPRPLTLADLVRMICFLFRGEHG